MKKIRVLLETEREFDTQEELEDYIDYCERSFKWNVNYRREQLDRLLVLETPDATSYLTVTFKK